MNSFMTNIKNWKVFVPVLGGALIVGAVIYNANSESSQNTTPAGETTAEAQTENIEVQIDAATLEENTKTPTDDNITK